MPPDHIPNLPDVPHAYAMPSEADLEDAKIRACDGMRAYGTKVYACRLSGIGRVRLNELIKSDPHFKRMLWSAKQEGLDELETAMRLRGSLPRGDLAGIFILKHNRERYREVQRVELTGRDGAPVAYVDAKEELLRRVQAALSRGALDVKALGAGGGRNLALERGQEAEKVRAQVTKVDGDKGVRGLRK